MSSKHTWVIGNHAVNAVLRLNPERVLALYCVINKNNSAQQEILNTAEKLGIALHPVDKNKLSKLCGSDHHQGVALQVIARREGREAELAEFIDQAQKRGVPLLLLLDQVQDPHNFGACLRTADAVGVDAVIVARDNASPLTAVVHKVASGAAETIPIFRVGNLARTMDSLKQQGIWMVGTSDQADQTLYQENLTGPLAMVMGAEGKGLRQLTEKKCDVLVSLPMAGSVVSSLNVSVATGVCLYEVTRQRFAAQ